MATDGPPGAPGPDPSVEWPTIAPAAGDKAAATGAPAAARHIGSYTVERELGRGGMGAVYLAEHDLTHEKVAMKELLITAAADPVAVKRFLQEGEVMQRLGHPNIVGVRAIIEGETGHYIALEFIDGGSLRDLLHGRPLPTPQAFAVMHGLLQALDHAHQHSIVHRDVKPENVMLSGQGEVKVADFGIARLTDDSATSTATKTGTTVGTPQYMSPEQVTTSKVDGRSDLYSAGIVCYEVFCGRPPFEATAADGPFTLFAKHVQAPPPPPTVIRPGLDPALEAVILKSLSKRPEDRYQTGAEFDKDLVQIANRLCGPDWPHALEPGADLSKMVPQVATTMGAIPVATTAMPAMATAGFAAQAPAGSTVPSAPVYAPKPPAHAGATATKGGPNLLLVGGVAAALVVIGLIVAFIALSQKPVAKTPTTPVVTASGNPGSAPCGFVSAGAAPAAGATGSCGITLGSLVQSDSFAGQSALPADLSGSTFNAGNTANGKATIPVSGGFATLNAPAKNAGVGVVTATAAPADLIAIADFTPTTAGDADIGIAARCTATDCVQVYVSPKGKVWIVQEVAGGAAMTRFNDSAQVPLNQANRLLVSVRGSSVQVWLNGSLVTSVQTDVSAPGTVQFFDVNQDAGAATVNLGGLYIFRAGP